jgi:pSer/pThr/pTyr-binding forkhead associated (FHA) protein
VIICPNCHKENQDHYKFCLSCGTKLPSAAPPPYVPPPQPPSGYGPPPPSHDHAPPGLGSDHAPPGLGSDHAPPGLGYPEQPAQTQGYVPGPGGYPPPPSGPSGPPSAFGASPPAPPIVGPPPSVASSSPTSAAPDSARPCPQCTFVNPAGFKFCGRCGGPLATPEPPPAREDVGSAQTIFVGDASEVQAAAEAHQAQLRAQGQAPTAEQRAMPRPPEPAPAPDISEDAPTYEGPVIGSSSTAASPPRFRATEPPVAAGSPQTPAPGGAVMTAKLVMLGPDGQPIGERVLNSGESLEVGRDSGPPWEDDAYLDPHHASLSVMTEGLQIEDTGSLNGIFLKLSERVEIQNGDQFRVGQELLLYEDLPEPTPTDDGTERMGSPNPGYWGRVSVLVDPNAPSLAFPIEGQGIAIGRENGDITFPQDGYVSGSHCRIVGDDNGVYMEDVGSSNGTYMRVRTGQIVPFGSLILIGQKLFQVERA